MGRLVIPQHPARLRTSVVILFLLGFGATGPCQGSMLEGRVELPDGAPAARAEVSILGRSGCAVTNDDGRFTWSPAPQPPFEVLVVLARGVYTRPQRIVEVPADGLLRLVIEPALDESVTVTAGLAPHVSPPPAAGMTQLTSREIEPRAPVNLTQALENVAGVASVSEGQAAVPAIRGFARGRTLILIDGARVSSERRVGPSATYLDPVVLESIEVARGPGSVAYGSDAFGGIIDARTRRAPPGRGTSGRFVGDLGAGIPHGRAALELARGFEQGGVLLQAHYRDFDDYESPEGEVLNSGARDYGARVRFDRLLGPGALSLAWQSDLGRDIERPRTNSATTRFFYPEENSHRLVASWEGGHVGGWTRLGASAFLGSYAIVTDQDTFATDETPRSVERADVSARDFHVRGYAGRPLGDSHIELGVDWNGRFDLEALDVNRYYDAGGSLEEEEVNVSIDDAHRHDVALYATAQVPAGRSVILDAGLRLDRMTTRNSGGYFGDRSTAQNAVSGFVAVGVAGAGGFSSTAQVSRGFRDPVLSDRYFRGPTGRGFITGNPDLQPETSLQLDLALRYTAARWRAAVYGFHYSIDDLIERYEAEPDFFYFRNRGKALVRGVELELQAEPLDGYSLELAAHLVRGEARDDSSPLDDMPPTTLTLKLTRNFAKGFVQARGVLYAKDDRPGPNEQERPGYGLLDAAAGWRLSEALGLRLLLRNLLDKSYLVSPDRRTVPAPGRSVVLGGVVSF